MSYRNYATTRNKLNYGKDYVSMDYATTVEGNTFMFTNIEQPIPHWRSILNDWERKFIYSCMKFPKLSNKQQAIILKIKDKYVKRF